MKNKLLSLLFLLLPLPCFALDNDFVNLTPTPKTMTVEAGELVLPPSFSISTTALPEEMVVEVERFAEALRQTTGFAVLHAANDNEALIQVVESASQLDPEGYQLDITSKGITVAASTADGLYFAFQSIKKMLPPHVMAGVADSKVLRYALPLVSINDAPRFGYRGFMLDTSRHYYTVKELKRVLDVMSYYKMNRFHWHITDDHGWRIQIDQYPRLTEIGSISDNSYVVDMQYGDYWLNRPYGPYFYTKEEVRDIVAYAQERHIEIVPEIDMPGHFCAAMAAYPEFSCTPNGNHNVISNIGGVYADVLNVANPGAVQFAKNILTEIMELFPGEYIHIGGDECPTSAWENNAECIAKKEELGLKSFRELQSHFIKDMADHVKANGRKLSVWNEAITANGADIKTIKETGATVYCWVGADGAAAKAAQLGLDHIYTPQIPWYINRKQSTDPGEPAGAGNGTDNLEKVYKQNIPVPSGSAAQRLTGVQATFWSEYVAFGNYLEYLMLPRLVAVAEAGWTPQHKKNFENFCRRITADSTLYNYNNYYYGKHYMQAHATDIVMPKVSNTEKRFWYRLVTKATDSRNGNCMELLGANSPLIEKYANKQAKKDRIWTNATVAPANEAYDYQLWCIEESPEKPGHYALVCKAAPEGSILPTPTATNNSGRWNYDRQNKHYNFLLADNGYGKDGNVYYYSLRCDQINGWWLNASLAGQGFAVNLYNNPADGNGGLWQFIPMEQPQEDATIQHLLNEARTYLAQVKTYATTAEKRPGYFDANATARLQTLVDQAPTAATDTAYATALKEAYQTFRLSFGYLEKGNIYTLENNVADFQGLSIYDSNKGNALRHTQNVWSNNAWEVTESTIHTDYSQTVKLKNVLTGRYIGARANNITGRIGYAVNLADKGAAISCHFDPQHQDFYLNLNGKSLFPIADQSTILPGTICCGSHDANRNAIRPQGTAWNIIPSRVVTFDCYDEANQPLGTYSRSFPIWTDSTAILPPEIHLYEYLYTQEGKSIYRRIAYKMTVNCIDETGAIIARDIQSCPVDSSYTVHIPEQEFYTLVESNWTDGTVLQPKEDLTITAVYTTTAYNGVKKLDSAVSTVQAGKSYVIYDTSPVDQERKGYRNVNAQLQVMKNNRIENTDPNHTWVLEESGKGFKVKNAYHQRYVPLLTTAPQPVHLSDNGGVYTFTLNADQETWKIKGTNGVCWDGLGSGALVGWNDPGHPYQLYTYFVQPYFEVYIKAVTTTGELLSAQKVLVKAGDSYQLTTTQIPGYVLKEVQGGEALSRIVTHTQVQIIYEDENHVGIETIQPDAVQKKGIYDLYGRKLQRIGQKGIYIINGQKVLVK